MHITWRFFWIATLRDGSGTGSIKCDQQKLKRSRVEKWRLHWQKKAHFFKVHSVNVSFLLYPETPNNWSWIIDIIRCSSWHDPFAIWEAGSLYWLDNRKGITGILHFKDFTYRAVKINLLLIHWPTSYNHFNVLCHSMDLFKTSEKRIYSGHIT